MKKSGCDRGAGFIGSRTDALVQDGHKVLIIDDLSSERPVTFQSKPSSLKVFAARRWRRYPASTHLVYHAAQIDVKKCSDPAFDAKVNISGLCNVVESARFEAIWGR